MATKKLPIVEATDDQIRHYCELQGLDTASLKTRSKLLGQLAKVWEHDYIVIKLAPEPEPEEKAATEQQVRKVEKPSGQLQGGAGLSDPICVVKLNSTETPGGKEPVPVAVGGRTIVVQRNVEVPLPYRFFLALENAVRIEVDQIPATPGNPGGDLVETEVANYPMQQIKMPSEKEIKDWHERTDNELMPA